MTHLPASLDALDVVAAFAALGFAAPEAPTPEAPRFAPGTLVLVDTLTGEVVEALGTDDEDEAEAVLEALNGPGGTRYTVDVA